MYKILKGTANKAPSDCARADIEQRQRNTEPSYQLYTAVELQNIVAGMLRGVLSPKEKIRRGEV